MLREIGLAGPKRGAIDHFETLSIALRYHFRPPILGTSHPSLTEYRD